MLSKDTKFKKGMIPWNKGKPNTWTKPPKVGFGKENPFYGRKHTLETKLKMSMAKLGKPSPNKGKTFSEEHRRNLSISHKGFKPSMITRLKISKANKGKKKPIGFGLKGKLSPSWKGGITSKNKIERARFRQTMQKQVFERDNYTCQLCGTRGVDLQVDHIQSWAEYVELRFSMDNCRTICMDCHYLVTYGKPKPKNVIWGHNLKHIIERVVA